MHNTNIKQIIQDLKSIINLKFSNIRILQYQNTYCTELEELSKIYIIFLFLSILNTFLLGEIGRGQKGLRLPKTINKQHNQICQMFTCSIQNRSYKTFILSLHFKNNQKYKKHTKNNTQHTSHFVGLHQYKMIFFLNFNSNL